MKALSMARKTLLELVREPLLIGLLLLFPLLVLGFYYVAFGQTEQGLVKYLTVWVLNEDDGAELGGQRWEAGLQLIEALRQAEFEGHPIFDVTVVEDRRAAEISLRERKIALLLVVPSDFSRAIGAAAVGENLDRPAQVLVVGDPYGGNFLFARAFLDDMIHQFVRYAGNGGRPSLSVAYTFVPGTGTMSDFDFGVPGVIVFALMFLTITTAMTMVREQVNGTLRRLRLSRAGSADLLLGVTLAQVVVALVLVPLTFGAALLFGFQGNGSLLLAMAAALLLSLAAVGLGLLTACFARNDGEAANLASVAGIMQVLVSGAMYPMPEVPLFSLAGRTIQIYDLLPPTHAAEALRQVLVQGKGLEAIGYELGALAVLSVVTLGVGVLLYRRLRMREA